MSNAIPAAPCLPLNELLALYEAKFPDDTVDWDMKGRRISSAAVILHGAYSPFLGRLLQRVAEESGHPITFDRLVDLAEEVFPQAEDRNFAGQLITEYKIVLEPDYGYGKAVLSLAQLIPELLAAPPNKVLTN